MRQAKPTEADNPLDGLIPDEPIQAIAWLGCLNWAFGREDVMALFRAETGNQWEPGSTAADRMIDEATGADAAFIRSFAEWFNESIWGDPLADMEDGE